MKKHKSMRLDESVIKNIDAIASKENRSFTNMVEVILIEYLDGAPFKRIPSKKEGALSNG